jgi:hypothetical protein
MIDLAGPLAGVVGGLIGLLIVAFIATRNDKKIVAGEINPRPRFQLPGVSKAEERSRAALVQREADALRQIPWGEHALPDPQEAERRYHEALTTIFVAAGDYTDTPPAKAGRF